MSGNYATPLGAEQVQRAASDMAHAAQELGRHIQWFAETVNRMEQVLADDRQARGFDR